VPVQKVQATNISRNQLLAEHVLLANHFFKRLRGLLFTNSLPGGQGLLIKPCNSIHMIGMTYNIDAIFINKENIVIATLSNLKPWQISSIYWQANACLELPAGTIIKSGTILTDQLQFSDY
jgi:uncharacterized membrane protein (UPF0127 family)